MIRFERFRGTEDFCVRTKVFKQFEKRLKEIVSNIFKAFQDPQQIFFHLQVPLGTIAFCKLIHDRLDKPSPKAK